MLKKVIKKSNVKIWVPGTISVLAFYERFYIKRNTFKELGLLGLLETANIYLKHSCVRMLLDDIEDFGFCVFRPWESVFGVETGYFPTRGNYEKQRS
jgi:hypothetical protein